MREAIEGAVGEDQVVEEGAPFVDGPIARDDRRRATVPFDEHVVEVAGLLGGGRLFVSESRRNRAQPFTLWTWSKVVRALALRAGVGRFSTHTPRHLCLTDLARSGWELHAIACFAGHRHVATTLQYIHLSGRELAAKFTTSMAHVHTWRRAALADLVGGQA